MQWLNATKVSIKMQSAPAYDNKHPRRFRVIRDTFAVRTSNVKGFSGNNLFLMSGSASFGPGPF
jgi:hypothetical protein